MQKLLKEPKKVCMDLLDFLDDKSHILLGDSKEEKALNGEAVLIDWETVSEPSHDVMNEVSMCLEALANLLTTNPGDFLLAILGLWSIFKRKEVGSIWVLNY